MENIILEEIMHTSLQINPHGKKNIIAFQNTGKLICFLKRLDMKIKINRKNLYLIYLMIMVASKAFGVNQNDSIYFIAFGVGLFF